MHENTILHVLVPALHTHPRPTIGRTQCSLQFGSRASQPIIPPLSLHKRIAQSAKEYMYSGQNSHRCQNPVDKQSAITFHCCDLTHVLHDVQCWEFVNGKVPVLYSLNGIVENHTIAE